MHVSCNSQKREKKNGKSNEEEKLIQKMKQNYLLLIKGINEWKRLRVKEGISDIMEEDND